MTTYNVVGIGKLFIEAITPMVTIVMGDYIQNPTEDAIELHYDGENTPTWEGVWTRLHAFLVEKKALAADDTKLYTTADLVRLAHRHLNLNPYGHADLLLKLGLEARNPDEHEDFLFQLVDMEIALELLRFLNDGHNAGSFEYTAAWTCSERKLFMFRGLGIYNSERVKLKRGSYSALQLGRDLDAALRENQYEEAADFILNSIPMTAIVDIEQRQKVAAALAAKLFL